MKRLTIHDIPLPGLSDAGFEIRHRQFSEALTRPARYTSSHTSREENLGKRRMQAHKNLGQRLSQAMARIFRRLRWA